MFYVHSEVGYHHWHGTCIVRHFCLHSVDSSNIPESPSFLDYLSINQPEKRDIKVDKAALKSFAFIALLLEIIWEKAKGYYLKEN